MVWDSRLFKSFPQFVVIHTIKGFSIVNEAEVDVFLELSCFFNDPTDVGNLISGSSAFSQSSLNIWKFLVHILLKLGWRIWGITLLVCEMSAILWLFEHSLALPFFGIGMKTDLFQRGHIRSKLTFSSPGTTAEFSKFAGILSAACSQHHLLGFEIAQLEFYHSNGIPSIVCSDASQGPLDFTFQDVWL